MTGQLLLREIGYKFVESVTLTEALSATPHLHAKTLYAQKFGKPHKSMDNHNSKNAEKSFERIEPLSPLTNLVSVRSSKRHGNRSTFSLHSPCPASPTIDHHSLLDRSKKTRLVNKYGSLNVIAKNVPGKAKLYFADLFTTMIDFHWPGVMLVFCISYVLSWVVFGLIWWLIVAVRGPSVCIQGVINKELYYFVIFLLARLTNYSISYISLVFIFKTV